jgi:hypothetical protein
MDDIAEQLKIRDSFRRKMAALKTPRERMRDLAQLQNSTWAVLQRSPNGYAHFMRRNFKARSISLKGSNGT